MLVCIRSISATMFSIWFVSRLMRPWTLLDSYGGVDPQIARRALAAAVHGGPRARHPS
jgi:hypothetical protein